VGGGALRGHSLPSHRHRPHPREDR
jgi:hypothetical protein